MIDNTTIAVAAKITLDFILHPGAVSQTVTVDGSGIQVNTTDATVSTVIDRQFISNEFLQSCKIEVLIQG